MNSFVNQLLDLERNAKDILEQANDGAARTLEAIENEKRRLLDEYTQKARDHLQTVRDSEAQQDRQLELELGERTERLKDEMESRFADNSRHWRDELFEICTGGDAM